LFINSIKRSDTLNKKDSKISIWAEDNKLFKAVYNLSDGCLTIYNECDEILILREHVTPYQMKAIELVFSRKGAKRIDNCKEPFVYVYNK
jgi:hypothetical protein